MADQRTIPCPHVLDIGSYGHITTIETCGSLGGEVNVELEYQGGNYGEGDEGNYWIVDSVDATCSEGCVFTEDEQHEAWKEAEVLAIDMTADGQF